MNKLDEIKLPKRSEKEELEQISKDKLRPLFDVKQFEVREEIYRDKGLDLNIELKYKNNYTNFRFIVQLKATETKKPNTDGSYSWQIDTSNVQYLLNAGIPAYYICYVKQNDTFYYRQLNDFITELSSKHKDWNEQDSHVLHASEILTAKAIYEIYEEVKNRLLATRELTEKLHIGKSGDLTKKVSITSEYKITDETSIVDLVEKIGLTIINEGKSKDIILLNERVSGDITSPLYNLTVGIAAYYTSNLFDSLAFFQKANREKESLPIHLVEHLKYFDALVKYSIGFIKQGEYLEILNSLKQSEHLQYYIQIEQAKEKYFNSLNEKGFNDFKNEMFSIIDNKAISSNIRFIASCEYLLFWGSKINMEHFQSIALINALEIENGPNKKLRIEGARDWLSQNTQWENFYQELNKEIVDEKDFFAFNMCKLNEVKVRFELIVYTSLVKFEKSIPDFPDSIHIDNSEQIEQMIKNLNKISDNYKGLYHIENLIATLSTKYEVLKFAKKQDEAEQVINEIQSLVDFHNLKEQKQKLDFLVNGGTTEDKVKHLIENTVEKSKSDREEYDKLVQEMKQFDDLEKKQKSDKEESVTIELFPIGHFSVLKGKIDKFYEILNIDSYKLTKNLNFFFENGIIPILNILNENITKEGYANGKLDDKGIESWRRIRVIRENLYKEKIRRQEIKYGL
ncbi:MAG: DUF4365 domain-containing protein [Urechidicola sp.]|nr:DUF4365 domain-containing protein [Urechidicola sp.]